MSVLLQVLTEGAEVAILHYDIVVVHVLQKFDVLADVRVIEFGNKTHLFLEQVEFLALKIGMVKAGLGKERLNERSD